MSKTSDDEWFTNDQAQWWDEQKRDEEELQRLREEELRDEIRDEIIEEFRMDYWPKIMEGLQDEVERLQDEAIAHGRFVYRTGFFHGFIAALMGAAVFFFIS